MGSGECVGTNRLTRYSMKKIQKIIFNRENLYALLLCLILIAIVIMTADKAPQWIYQGF